MTREQEVAAAMIQIIELTQDPEVEVSICRLTLEVGYMVTVSEPSHTTSYREKSLIAAIDAAHKGEKR